MNLWIFFFAHNLWFKIMIYRWITFYPFIKIPFFCYQSHKTITNYNKPCKNCRQFIVFLYHRTSLKRVKKVFFSFYKVLKLSSKLHVVWRLKLYNIYKDNLQSLPASQAEQRCFIWALLARDSGPHERMYNSRNLALWLYTSDTGGDDLTVTGDRWRWFQEGIYLLPRVWTSRAPLFDRRVGVDSLLCFKVNIAKATFKTLSKMI